MLNIYHIDFNRGGAVRLTILKGIPLLAAQRTILEAMGFAFGVPNTMPEPCLDPNVLIARNANRARALRKE